MSDISAHRYPAAQARIARRGSSVLHGLVTDVAVNGENMPSRVHWSLGSTLCLAFVSSAVLWGVIIAGANLVLRAIA